MTKFFPSPRPISLVDIAEIIGEEIPESADHSVTISAVASLSEADGSCISFLENPKYLDQLANSKAKIVLCKSRYLEKVNAVSIGWPVKKPYEAYAKIAAALFPDSVAARPVLHRTSAKTSGGFCHPTASIAKDVVVEANASVGEGAEIGEGSVVCAGAVVGHDVKIGRDCYIGPNVSLQHSLLGDRVAIHANSSIGQDGFGYAMGPTGHLKVPQLGRVVIQDDVEIGALTSIDRGTNQETVIGEGTKIDNQVQIAHNVRIGRHCVIVSQVGIAGSATLGDFVVIGGKSGVIGHVTVGDGAQIAALSAVHDNMPAGARWGGVPAKPVREWFREVTLLNQLAKKELNTPTKE